MIRRKLDLSSLDNSNGVDVMLNASSISAVENVVLIEGNGNKLEYHATPW